MTDRARSPAPALIGLGASAVWLLLCALLWWTAPEAAAPLSAPARVMLAAAVIGPLGLVWLGVLVVSAGEALHAQGQRSAAAAEAVRKALNELRSMRAASPAASAPAPVPRGATRPPAAGAPARPAAPPAKPEQVAPQNPGLQNLGPEQPGLAFGGPEDRPPPPGLAPREIIRALNFPEHSDDREGFRALRRALADRETGRLVRAAQDALTLLSQEGLYMDDLAADRAHPDLWRRFAAGERGASMAQIGGIRAPAPLEKVAARMRADPIFRDTAHHFLRQFDRQLASFAPTATDAELAALAETRTARAVMLLGRVTGMFG